MKKNLCIAVSLLSAFILWTLAVCLIDVKAIGPEGSSVGLATINGYFHNLTGVNFTLYTVTDWLGLVPVFICFGFGLLGLVQWIKRRKLSKVDYDIIVLGGFYAVVITAYILFEEFAINYRPVLINGYLETSYPSSTTLLTLCVMPTAAMQFDRRIKNTAVRRYTVLAITVFTAFMVIGRLVSGVHWLSDIIGGALLSAGLVMIYKGLTAFKINCDSKYTMR